jgi:phage tail-like protein
MRRLPFTCLLAAMVACLALVASDVARPASAAPERKDPLTTFVFGLKISDLGVGEGTAFFKSVSGLSYETEVVDYQEGGANDVLRKPGRTRMPTLLLERDFAGQSPDDPILRWYREIRAGKDVRKNITITIVKRTKAGDETIARYECLHCFPSAWRLSKLDGIGNDVPTEEIEITVEKVEEA